MILSEDEWFIFVVAAVVALVGALQNRVSRLPRWSLRDNPGPGLVRLAVLASLGWTAFVLARYADPSVKGFYNVFYLVMGYAAVQFVGGVGVRMFGIHLRVDVGERRNWAAAVFVAAFLLGTGIIFGASLWGEADPVGSEEGGWWIPLGFFLLGWTVMTVGLALYCWREPGAFRRRIRQERDAADALGAAGFTVNAAILMANAVSGDFWGWTAGLKDVGLPAVLLIVHEFVRLPARLAERKPLLRKVETGIYFGIVAINLLARWLR